MRLTKTSGTNTFFAYDEAGHLIGEYDATGAPIEATVWLGDLPVAVLKPKTGGFDVFYVWADHLGTPRQITDTLNQSRWEWPNADPFGNNAPNENPAGLGTFSYNLRFPGQYYDSEKGSNYNYFRDYDPALGRYVESDPIGLHGGANTYVYALNRALALSDAIALTGNGDALAAATRKHALEKITEIGKDIPGMAAGDAVGELGARVLCQRGVKPFDTDKCLQFCTEFVVPIRDNFIDTMPPGPAQGLARRFADQQAGGIIDDCTTHCVKRLTELDEEKRKKTQH